MNVVVLDGFTLNPGDLSWEGFKKFSDITVYDKTSPAELIERAKDADAILLNKVVITKEILEMLPKLKYIGILATGYNVVDIKASNEKGIIVTNIPSYGPESVAQLVFAFIMHFSWRVKEHSDEVMQGKWTNCEHFCYHSFPPHELSFKTIGIIGFGHIGQAVAKIALALNMNVIYSNRTSKQIQGLEKAQQVDIDYLLKTSDFISLNCPLNDKTKHIINSESLKLVKNSTYIINTGRGPLIDEMALSNALTQNKIAGFAGDVLSTEPPNKDNPLLQAKNCIITPHIAWQTYEARERLMKIAIQNLKAFIDGKPENKVIE